jgi:hypothetical protein
MKWLLAFLRPSSSHSRKPESGPSTFACTMHRSLTAPITLLSLRSIPACFVHCRSHAQAQAKRRYGSSQLAARELQRTLCFDITRFGRHPAHAHFQHLGPFPSISHPATCMSAGTPQNGVAFALVSPVSVDPASCVAVGDPDIQQFRKQALKFTHSPTF